MGSTPNKEPSEPGKLTIPDSVANSILFYKLLNSKKTSVENADINMLKKRIIVREKNELFSLYSNNYLSKIKNSIFIKIK